MIPAEIRRRYEITADDLQYVEQTVRETVFAYCQEMGFAFSGRKKALDSLAEKLESGRYGSWAELDDLYGCSIIIPTLESEPRILEFLSEVFNCAVVRGRGQTRQSPQVFRFDATRFIGTVSPIRDRSSAHELQFEVQIRTAFEHAWSVTTHHLYKPDRIDWKLQRLAAQLKASVEQLDSLVATYQQSADAIIEHQDDYLAAQGKILEFFKDQATGNKLSPESIPKSWGRFAENVFAMISKADCKPFRYKTIDEKTELLLAACDAELTQKDCPTSISLFQFTLGVAIERKVIQGTFREGYFPLVTPELETFFPRVGKIGSETFRFF